MDLRFALIIFFILMMNAGYVALQIWLLRRRRPWPVFIGYALGAWVVVLQALFFFMISVPDSWEPFLRHWLFLPLTVETIWNVLFIVLLCPAMILVVLMVRLLRPVKPDAPPLSAEGLSRRQFLYVAAYSAAPVAALGMGVHGTLSRDDLRVNHLTIPVAGLPPELEGFTIAHVSDLHSGIFVGPERLRRIHDATNDLKPDVIALTGDIINNNMGEFPSALASIQGMEARHGVWLCEGNHDLIPGAEIFDRACAENQLALLRNSCTTITVEGRRLLIAGLPWMKRGFENHHEIVSSLYPARQEGDVRVLLAHHPHLFDIAESTDLVLSGHTHGGQIMLGPVGIGPVFFKYWSGLYRRGNTSMVVSNGCGDWFPCRIGAPAEVGLLRLTKA